MKATFTQSANGIILACKAIGWIALVLIICFLTYLVLSGKIGINSFKAADFEVTLAKNARELDVKNTPEFEHMKDLNEDELRLFLIMGGDEAKSYIFRNTAVPNDVMVERYKK